MKNSRKISLDAKIVSGLRSYLSFIWDDIKGEESPFLCAGGFPRYIGLLQLALSGDKRAQDLFDDWEILKDATEKSLTIREVSKMLLASSDAELFEVYTPKSETLKFMDMPFYLARFFIAPYSRREAFENIGKDMTTEQKNESYLSMKDVPNMSDRDIDFFIRDEKALLNFVLRLGDSIYSWASANKKDNSDVAALFTKNPAPAMPGFLKVPTLVAHQTQPVNLSHRKIVKVAASKYDEDSFTEEAVDIQDVKRREEWDCLIEYIPNLARFENDMPKIVETIRQKDIKFVEEMVLRRTRSIEDLIIREKILYLMFHDPNKINPGNLLLDLFEDIETSKEKFVSKTTEEFIYRLCLAIFKEIYFPVLEGTMSLEDAKYNLDCICGDYTACSFYVNYDTAFTKYATSVKHFMTTVKNLSSFLDKIIESKPASMSAKQYIGRIAIDVSHFGFDGKNYGDSPRNLSIKSIKNGRELFAAWQNYCIKSSVLPKMQFITGEDLLFGDEDSLFDNFDIQNCAWKLDISEDNVASIEVSNGAIEADLGGYFKINHGRSLFTAKRLKKYASREKAKKILYSDEALREWCNNLFFDSFEKENGKGVKYSKKKILDMAAFWDIPHDIACMFVGSFDIKQLEEVETYDYYEYGSLKKRDMPNKKLIANNHDWAMTYMNKQEEKRGENNDKNK